MTLEVEKFLNPKNKTRYRIVVDGRVVDDLGGMGWRSEEKALNYWYFRNGLPVIKGEDGVKKAERRATHLAEMVKQAEQKAADEAAEAEARNKILTLLDQQPIWNEQELQVAVGVNDITFIRSFQGLNGKVVYTRGSDTVHRKTKELTALRSAARKAVRAPNNAPIKIIPVSNTAPTLTGERASGYSRRKWGRYQPSTLLVTVGQHWLIPVVEAIAEDYNYDE